MPLINPIPVFSNGISGLVPNSDEDASKFLSADGNFLVPSGGGGGGLNLISSVAISSPLASVPFINLDYSELYLLINSVVFATNDTPRINVSVNNGSTYYNTTGDYDTFASNGLLAGATVGASTNLTSSTVTTPQSSVVWFPAANENGIRKNLYRLNRWNDITTILASNSPINAIRVIGAGGANMTGGTIALFGR